MFYIDICVIAILFNNIILHNLIPLSLYQMILHSKNCFFFTNACSFIIKDSLLTYWLIAISCPRHTLFSRAGQSQGLPYKHCMSKFSKIFLQIIVLFNVFFLHFNLRYLILETCHYWLVGISKFEWPSRNCYGHENYSLIYC